MSDDKKVIFSMQKLSKTYTGADKPVLKNIYLSFFYGAKIGILGLNGSGKSSLLKIIAGVDKNYQGDVVFQPGYTVGYLEQEPILDDSKTVLEIVGEWLFGSLFGRGYARSERRNRNLYKKSTTFDLLVRSIINIPENNTLTHFTFEQLKDCHLRIKNGEDEL